MAPRGAVIVLGVVMVALLTISASEVTARELTEETSESSLVRLEVDTLGNARQAVQSGAAIDR